MAKLTACAARMMWHFAWPTAPERAAPVARSRAPISGNMSPRSFPASGESTIPAGVGTSRVLRRPDGTRVSAWWNRLSLPGPTPSSRS